MKDNISLERYEFKYLLPNNLANKIESEIKHFMKLDDFALNNPNNQYFVNSIYFEDDFNTGFNEKINGYRIRKKYRFRTYEHNEKKNKIFLEVKGRNLERTYKKRVTIPKEYLVFFKTKKNCMKLLDLFPNNEIIKNFVYDVLRKNLKPIIKIDYYRRPYVISNGLYFRLTFDNNLSSSKINKLEFTNKSEPNVLCKAGKTILELKFERSIPAWFHRIIQCYNLRRMSISKYVLGICSSKLGHETSE
jgi:SPX domain protein involved in polyphosphate accumulation